MPRAASFSAADGAHAIEDEEATDGGGEEATDATGVGTTAAVALMAASSGHATVDEPFTTEDVATVEATGVVATDDDATVEAIGFDATTEDDATAEALVKAVTQVVFVHVTGDGGDQASFDGVMPGLARDLQVVFPFSVKGCKSAG